MDIQLKCHRSSHHRCSAKKLFLKILQYSQENTCFFNKVAGLHNFFRYLLQNYSNKKTCKWFFVKPQARKHANDVCFHKLILATSNMTERAKQYVHFCCWTGLSAHTRRKTMCIGGKNLSDYSFKRRESRLIWITQ